jgi:hypothetical protein
MKDADFSENKHSIGSNKIINPLRSRWKAPGMTHRNGDHTGDSTQKRRTSGKQLCKHRNGDHTGDSIQKRSTSGKQLCKHRNGDHTGDSIQKRRTSGQ